MKKGRFFFEGNNGTSSLFFAIILLLSAIVLKLLLTYYFFVVDTDKLFQALAAKNLIEGYGLTTKEVHANNLNLELIKPVIGWPPGYSLLLAPIIAITRSIDLSCFIVDIMATAIFFVVLYKLLLLLKFPKWLTVLLILFNALYISEYIVYSTATDLIAVDFCLLSIYLTIHGIRNKFNTASIILLACLNIAPAFLRYMYMPSSFIIPLLLVWNGIRLNRPELKKAGYRIYIVSAIAIAGLLTFQKLYTGGATYAGAAERGFFPSNWQLLHPIVFSSFMNLQFYASQLSNLFGTSYQVWSDFFRVLNFAPFALLIFTFIRYLVKKRLLIQNEWDGFIISAGLISLTIFVVLLYLSFTYDSHLRGAIWTYIADRRYYILPTILLPIVAARILFTEPKIFPGLNILKSLFLLLVLIEITHGLYFLGKHFTLDRRRNPIIVENESLVEYAKKTIMQNRNSNYEIVFGGNSSIANRSTLFGGKALVQLEQLNAAKIDAQQPTKLIVIVNSKRSQIFSPFLKNKEVKRITQIGKYIIYSLEVE